MGTRIEDNCWCAEYRKPCQYHEGWEDCENERPNDVVIFDGEEWRVVDDPGDAKRIRACLMIPVVDTK